MSDWKSRAIAVPENHDLSWKDRAEVVPEPGDQPTIGGDLAKGAAQGLAMGFADEIEGGLKGGAEKIKDLITGKESDLEQLYRKYQQLAQKDYKAAQERSPIAYNVGAVGGALLPLVGTAGLGAAAKGGVLAAKGAGALAAGAEGAAALASPTAAALKAGLAASEVLPEASMLAKTGSAALQGAGIGAVQGAGESEHTLAEPGKLLEDVKGGAESGALVGGALSLAGSGLKSAGKGINNWWNKAAEDNPFMRKVEKSYGLGKEGKDLASEKVQLELARAPGDTSHQLVKRVQEIDSSLGKQVGDSIDEATEQGMRFDFNPNVKQAFSDLEQHFQRNPTIAYDRDAAKTFEYLKRQMTPKVAAAEGAVIDPMSEVTRTVSPAEAKQMVSELHDMGEKLSGATDQNSVFLKDTINKVINGIDGDLETNIPKYLQAKKRFIDFRQNVPETIIAKQKPQEVVGKWYGDRRNKTNDLYSSLENTLGTSGFETQGANKAKVARDNMVKGLEEFSGNEEKRLAAGEIPSNALPKEEVTGITKTARDIADQTALLGQAQGYSGHEGLGSTFQKGVTGISTVGKGAVASLANKAGVLAQSAPVKLSKSLYNAPKAALSEVATTLNNTPGTQFLGKALEEGIANGSQSKINAAVFAVLQNPSARKLLQPEEETK